MLLATTLLASPLRAGDPMDTCVASYVQAQRLRKAGDLVGSKAELLSCLAPRCPNVLHKDCRAWLREVEAATPSFVVEARDAAGQEAQISVTLDGQPVSQPADAPIPVNPGAHVFEVRSGGAQTATYRVLARPGDKGRRLSVVLEPRIPREVWVLAGVGLAEAGVATYFVFRGHGILEDCGQSCTPGDSNAVRVANTAAGISAGMAALSFGAAGWLYFTRPRARWTEPAGALEAPQVGVRMQPTGAVFELAGQF